MSGQGETVIRILVIDARHMLATAISRFLDGEADMEVVGQSGSWPAAAQTWSHGVPDVAVVHFDMPGVDAAEQVQLLLEGYPGMRAVALSASTDERKVLAAITAGCSGVVAEERMFDDLVRAVRMASIGASFVPTSAIEALLAGAQPSRSPDRTELSIREAEVLALTAEGLSNREVALRLCISVHTARNHIQNVLSKLHAHSRLEAVIIATRRGILRSSSSKP